MLSWIGKCLPYFIIIKLVRKFGSEQINCKELGTCRAWRLDKGEWIIWSQQNYDRVRENERETEEYIRLAQESEEKEKLAELKEKYESASSPTKSKEVKG